MDKLILASASKSRRDLLINAGLDVDIIPSHVDENILKAENLNVEKTALLLAEEKAKAVSKDYPDQFVIGADQMMQCQGMRFDKPVSMAQAYEHLSFLKGKTHHLISAVCVVKAGQTVWSYLDQADLEMRDFSPDFLENYLKIIGDDVKTTVGGYRLEETGIQLFKSIKGDYFTILGLPLVPLLDFLRSQDVISS